MRSGLDPGDGWNILFNFSKSVQKASSLGIKMVRFDAHSYGPNERRV
jgi:hypothetical protein